MSKSAPSGSLQSYIYVIGDAEQSVVKIGWSRDPRKRRVGLQTSSPFPLSLWWVTEGGRDLEEMLHLQFAGQGLGGEWFDFPRRDAVARVKEAVERLREPSQRRHSPPPHPLTHKERWELVRRHLAEGRDNIRFITINHGMAGFAERRVIESDMEP